MKARIWLLLTALTFLVGCAQGYYTRARLTRSRAKSWSGLKIRRDKEDYDMRIGGGVRR